MPPTQNSPAPRRRSRVPSKPPEAMTMADAKPILVVAALLDLSRVFFTFFVFFAPAIATAVCVGKVTGWVGSLWGLTATVCTAGGVAAGVVASVVTIPFGLIMADAMGLAGFLLLGLWVAIKNPRLLKTVKNAKPQFISAFGVGELPFIGALPVFTFILYRIYRAQIQIESVAVQKWEQARAAEQQQDRQEQMARAAQIRNAQIAQAQNEEVADYDQFEEEAANDEQYDEVPGATRKPAYTINANAANDETYIPQDERKAA